MTNNNTKQNLLNLFADNVAGEITANTIRKFIEDVFDDKEVHIAKFDSLSSFNSSLDTQKTLIFEGSLVAITNSTDIENGLYISLANLPKTSDLLMQFSSNSKITKSKVTYTDVTAQDGQFAFNAVYTDNLVEVYVDGNKRAQSRIQINSSPTTLGTTVILLDPAVAGEVVEIKATVL